MIKTLGVLEAINNPQNKEDFHKERQNYLGASDAAPACGVSVYRTQVKLYNEKLGTTTPFEGNAATRLGNVAELGILKEYIEQAAPNDAVIVYQPGRKTSELDFIACHADAMETSKSEGKWIIEIKTISDINKLEGTIEDYEQCYITYPDWFCQNQHQLFCYADEQVNGVKQVILDKKTGYITVYRMRPHPALMQKIIEKETTFWLDYVSKRQPPPPNIKEIEKPTKDVNMTSERESQARKIIELKQELKDIGKLHDSLKDEFTSSIETDIKVLKGETLKVTRIRYKGRKTLSKERILANYPEIDINKCYDFGEPYDSYRFTDLTPKEDK